MSLYKRDNTWWIDFTTAAGERTRCSADTSNKLEAQELHDRLKAASWRVARLGDRRQYTWLPEHQREMVLFALATGLRQGNVTGLCWSQVDLARRTAWVHGEDVKNGDDLHVSLNNLAMDVLQRQHGKHPERVFTSRASRSTEPTRAAGAAPWSALASSTSAGTIGATPGPAG